MRRHIAKFGLGICIGLVLAGIVRAADPSERPLGHQDFYPSAQRPVGFRGDGNGYFPGATPVTEWREGTAAWITEDKHQVPLLLDRRAHNVVWKIELPSWANSQPIVAGDRVFVTAEPNLLVCVDACSGRVLWSQAANPWELAGVEPPLADRLQEMYDIRARRCPSGNP